MQLQGSRSSSHFTLFSRESSTQQVVFALSTAALRFDDLHLDSQLKVQGSKSYLRSPQLHSCSTILRCLRENHRRSKSYLRSPQLHYASTSKPSAAKSREGTLLPSSNLRFRVRDRPVCKLPSIPGLVVLVYSVRNQIQVGFMTAELAPPLSFNSTPPS
jgi:hypothetical protein